MKVLVVGGGGREHALVWKLNQSSRVSQIFCAPGNAGIAKMARCVDVDPKDIPRLVDLAKAESIDLTVVGPEAPLAEGIVDAFEEAGLRIFGPSREAACIESSKVFAKEFMVRHRIPTAPFRVFSDPTSAKEYVREADRPLVVKADGLAAGKGSIVADDCQAALEAVDRIMVRRQLGAAGSRVVIEEKLQGEELSVLGFVDGHHVLLMPAAQDHKPLLDGDRGPNTGGMGAYCPVPRWDRALERRVLHEVMIPAVRGLAAEGRPYRGVLYAGLMLDGEDLYVLEFNCRFGDPETQVLMPLLGTDLVSIIEASLKGRLRYMRLRWSREACVCVVMASGGYPGHYERGKVISGLEEAESLPGVIVFHAGTARDERGQLVTAGGRVLGVTAVGKTLGVAIERAYRAAGRIRFAFAHYRKDIGFRALTG